MADTPEALAEKVRHAVMASMASRISHEAYDEAHAALDALLARLAEAEKDRDEASLAAANEQDRGNREWQTRVATEADRDRYKAANLTDEEARIVLIGLDAIQEYGWDGAPYTNVLQSAIDKLEALAGDLEQATVHPLQQKLEP